MSTIQQTIKETKPNIDCKYCVINNYLKSDGKTPTKEQYALCNNPKKTHGCCHIDIVYKTNNLSFETSCQNCKEYESLKQLKLFE